LGAVGVRVAIAVNHGQVKDPARLNVELSLYLCAYLDARL